MTPRAAGVLLHPTSLPGPFGVGDLGIASEEFIAWASDAGLSVWQVLPLGPTGYRNSPYGCLSAFAGNPILISPERLVADGLLDRAALDGARRFREDEVDYQQIVPWKERILRASWDRFRGGAPAEPRRALEAYLEDPRQAGWLEDWALYASLKARHGGREWTAWDGRLARRDAVAIEAARRELAEEMGFHMYVQFLFFRQWDRVKRLANGRGMRIMGDVPFYVAHDSADTWTNARLFALDENGQAERVGGVPPDYFSASGQLWGTPVYRWDRVEAEGFSWLTERLEANFRLADLVRLDHFRGFAAWWEVDARAPNAVDGRWVEGPGARFFDAVRKRLGDVPLVAEDLGMITPDVEALRASQGLPGMKVLQFAFAEPDSLHLPVHHGRDSVVYTGTHDNDTTRGWFASLGEDERRRVLDLVGTDGSEIEWDMIRVALASEGLLVIVPAQDILGLGPAARMNTPGRANGNWAWRARREVLTPALAARVRALAAEHGRAPSP